MRSWKFFWKTHFNARKCRFPFYIRIGKHHGKHMFRGYK